MNEDNLTKSTILSTPNLPVPSNGILTTKSSPTRLTSLSPTLPLSSLSLPPLLTQSIPSVSCYNHITCQSLRLYFTKLTFLTSNLLSSSHPSTCVQGINQEVIAANTPNSESTTTSSQFQASYVTPMQYPGVLGSLFFE